MNTKRYLQKLGLVWVAALALIGGVAKADHLTDANQLVNNLIVSKKNVYGTDPSSIVWNGTNSEARTVCATFVTLLLQHSYNWTPTTFSNWMGSNSPNAALYHDTIVAQNGFTRITNIANIQAGDILAVKYFDEGSTNSGHAMVAAGAPVARTATAPLVDGTNQYELLIIDSSKSYHGNADTRFTSGVAGGVGRGTLRLYTNANGTIVGYTWSTFSNSIYYTPNVRDLVVGRLN